MGYSDPIPEVMLNIPGKQEQVCSWAEGKSWQELTTSNDVFM